MSTVRTYPWSSVGSHALSLPKELPKDTHHASHRHSSSTLTTGKRAERLVVDANGLYLRLRKGKGGISRTWQFRRREADKLSVVTLGTYPVMTLKDARLRAAELASKRDLECPTVGEAAEQWLAERVNTMQRRANQVEGCRACHRPLPRSSPHARRSPFRNCQSDP
jgi:hypothetical protein